MVREYAGHGIGQELHEDPLMPHYGPPNKGPRLMPGLVLCTRTNDNLREVIMIRLSK
ncbi:hypothetical protein ACQKCU_23430 [Heyndrickxia sporothermodurans]